MYAILKAVKQYLDKKNTINKNLCDFFAVRPLNSTVTNFIARG